MAYDASPVKTRQLIKIQASRWQCGNPPQLARLRRQCGQKSPTPSNHFKTLRSGVNLRPKHGYLATNYDASAVNSPKIFRRQFGR